MFRGARIAPTAVQNYTTIGANDALRFAAADYDTEGLWDAGQPNRLTIPAGVSKVRLRMSVQADTSDPLAATNSFRFRKNGTIFFAGSATGVVNVAGYTNPGMGMVSDVIDVVEGDYFEAVYFTSATFSLNHDRGETWFAVEIIELTDSTAYRTTDLLDVSTTEPADGQVLVYDADAEEYVPGTPQVVFPEESSIYKPFRGALIKRTADTSSINGSYSPVIWQAAEYDTDSFWSAGAPSRLTIPADSGILRVRLFAAVETSNMSGNLLCRIMKNGSSAFIGTINMGNALATAGYSNTPFSAMTTVINVEEGDYFEVLCSATDTAWNAMAARSCFAIEVVEAEAPLP